MTFMIKQKNNFYLAAKNIDATEAKISKTLIKAKSR